MQRDKEAAAEIMRQKQAKGRFTLQPLLRSFPLYLAWDYNVWGFSNYRSPPTQIHRDILRKISNINNITALEKKAAENAAAGGTKK